MGILIRASLDLYYITKLRTMKRILLFTLLNTLFIGGLLALNTSSNEEYACQTTSEAAFAVLPTAQLSASYAGLGPDQGDEPGYDTYQVIGAGWVTGAQD